MPVSPTQFVPFSLDEVPEDVRAWVEPALVVPLNRLVDNLRDVLDHGISLGTHINAQVVERRFLAPDGSDWSAHRLDHPLTISGKMTGVHLLSCWSLDGAGLDSAPVGGLPSPVWREVVAEGRKQFRLVFQSGLTDGVKYRISYLLWGA